MHIKIICRSRIIYKIKLDIMELREFFAIFVFHKKIFWGVIFSSMVIGIIFFFAQPQAYKTSMTLNITRDHVQSTSEYMYDDFYRLQADEKFADTAVQWILSEHLRVKVFGPSSSANISAKRMSSQVIDVEYKTRSVDSAKESAEKLISVLNIESQKLNKMQQKIGWFVILGSDPIIMDATYSFHFLLMLFFAIGFFIAFWSVMIIHYVIGSADKK